MTAVVSCDRSARLWIDQTGPWAGNAMRAARVPETRGPRCRRPSWS